MRSFFWQQLLKLLLNIIKAVKWYLIYFNSDIMDKSIFQELSTNETLVNELNTVGKRLKYARKKLKLSQIDLSNKTGCGQSTISDIESDSKPNTSYLIKIARALNVSVDWLETGELGNPNQTATAIAPLANIEFIPVLTLSLSDLPQRNTHAPINTQEDYVHYKEVGSLPFQRDFFERHNLEDTNFQVFLNESMEIDSFLRIGDYFGLNTNRSGRSVKVGKYYLMIHKKKIAIRKLSSIEENLYCFEHPLYRKDALFLILPDQNSDITILGELVWKSCFI